MSTQSLCTPENLINTREVLTPSGRYRLTIFTYKTSTPERPNTWNVTKGVICSVEDEENIIATIYRNFGFTYTFFNRVNDHGVMEEWLCTGKTYTSQCFVNLNTGQQYDNLESDTRNNFCWQKVYPSPDGHILAVMGCIWACPYEIIFYDFSNPEAGWPTLKYKDLDLTFDLYYGDYCKHNWIGNDIFEFEQNEGYSSSLNKSLDELTEEEWNLIPDDEMERDEYRLLYRIQLQRMGSEMVYLTKESTPRYNELITLKQEMERKLKQFNEDFTKNPRYLQLKSTFPSCRTYLFNHNGCFEDLESPIEEVHFGAEIFHRDQKFDLRCFKDKVQIKDSNFPNLTEAINFILQQ